MRPINPEDVTLYIPARNAAGTLQAAIDSVRGQTVPPADFFVVLDTRSSDTTPEIARRSGVPLVTQTEGRLGHGRNLAIQACRTPWLASCDADVVLEPTWLEALLRAADENVAAVGGCTHERLLTDSDRWRAVNMPHNWGPLPFDNPFMLVSEMMAWADALRSVGGYRADWYYGDDSDLCRRLRDAGYVLRYEPAAVAYHHRGDSVESVLNLRWNYSFNRQRSRLESLPGLISKLPINRVYCLQSLSQTLHSEHADCCAISLLLWLHHARRDLQAVLEKWPLLDEAARANCPALLDEAITECLSDTWQGILPPMRRLLPIPEDAAVDPPRHTLAATSGFQRYLAAVCDATRDLLNEIPRELLPPLLQSAERLANGARRDSRTSNNVAAGASPGRGAVAAGASPGRMIDGSTSFFRLPRLEVHPQDRERLAAQPLRPAWKWTELQDALSAAVESTSGPAQFVECGPHLPAERPTPSLPGTGEQSPRVALLPHLEASPTPREILREALATADVAVIAYQPPQVFIAAVPILSARDLASQCATAGFLIRHFYTEAGLTRLIVQREQATPATHPRERVGAVVA